MANKVKLKRRIFLWLHKVEKDLYNRGQITYNDSIKLCRFLTWLEYRNNPHYYQGRDRKLITIGFKEK